MKKMRNKIFKTISKLDETNFQASLDWYFILNDYAKSLAERNGLTLVQASGVISALSPMITFQTNLRDAERFCSTRRLDNLATYMNQRKKALAIIGAKSEEDVLKILGGNKTKSFFLNILKPETSQDVTIDSWMIKFFGYKSLTPKRYKEASEVISQIALEMKIKPHQLQALIWVGMRGKAF